MEEGGCIRCSVVIRQATNLADPSVVLSEVHVVGAVGAPSRGQALCRREVTCTFASLACASQHTFKP